MRLIDADTIKQRIIAFCTGWRTTYLTVENILMLINRTDTVDAVPVVRCKDCVAFEQKGKYPAGMPEYPDEMPYKHQGRLAGGRRMSNEPTYMDCWHFIAPLIPVNTDYTMDIYVMVFNALKEAEKKRIAKKKGGAENG